MPRLTVSCKVIQLGMFSFTYCVSYFLHYFSQDTQLCEAVYKSHFVSRVGMFRIFFVFRCSSPIPPKASEFCTIICTPNWSSPFRSCILHVCTFLVASAKSHYWGKWCWTYDTYLLTHSLTPRCRIFFEKL